MKFGLFFLIGLFLLSASAFGELSVADLDKIRGIVTESETRLRTEIEQLRAEMAAVEKRLRAEIELLRAENAASEKRLRAEAAASEARTNKQLDRNFVLLVGQLGFIAVVIGIPLTLVALQLRKERARDEQLNAQQRLIDAQQQKIEGLSQELETLKEQRILR